MKVAHFYHVWAAGQWEKPVAEHLTALTDSGFDGPFYVGLIGNSRQRREALAAINARRQVTGTIERASGYEQPTIDAVHRWSKHYDGAVLYAHSKGAAYGVMTNGLPVPPGKERYIVEDRTPQDVWRRAMTDRVVRRWRACQDALATADAVGILWTVDRGYNPHFAGNFWMARCDYLRTLPRCRRDGRWHAETWIALGNPRICEAPPALRVEPSVTAPGYVRVRGFACARCRAGLDDADQEEQLLYAPIVADQNGNVCCYAPHLSREMVSG